MSTKYQSGKDVPTEVLAARLNELADVVARKRDRIGDEFTMRIPAECDRDADLVMSEAARRLSAVPDVQGGPVAISHDFSEQEKQHAEKQPVYQRCEYCDGTGDVHSLEGEWRGTCDCPAGQQPAPDIEAAARKLAESFDYPWEYMPEQGRENMRKNAMAVIEAAHRKQGGVSCTTKD